MKKCSGIFAAFLLGIAGVTVTPAICYGAVVHQMVTEEIRVFQPEDVKESEDGSEKLEMRKSRKMTVKNQKTVVMQYTEMLCGRGHILLM